MEKTNGKKHGPGCGCRHTKTHTGAHDNGITRKLALLGLTLLLLASFSNSVSAQECCEDFNPPVYASDLVSCPAECLPGGSCDQDADGYVIEACYTNCRVNCPSVGSPWDCDDSNPSVHPGWYEQDCLCFDGIDNDCDGLTDSVDNTIGAYSCTCRNGIDQNNDTKTDCADPLCRLEPYCAYQGKETDATECGDPCADDFDNDGDGLVDEEDPDCQTLSCNGLTELECAQNPGVCEWCPTCQSLPGKYFGLTAGTCVEIGSCECPYCQVGQCEAECDEQTPCSDTCDGTILEHRICDLSDTCTCQLDDTEDCDDGSQCTVDSCNPASGCTNDPSPDLGMPCTYPAPGPCGQGTVICSGDYLTCGAGSPDELPEVSCDNQADDDCDGDVDCADSDCDGVTFGSCTAQAPGVCSAGTVKCTGGILNCVSNGPTEQPETSCTDGLDNDCDEDTDCDDGDCTGDPACVECTDNSDCDDQDVCTSDSCSAGACVNTPITGCCHTNDECVDDLWCNGQETCFDNECVPSTGPCTGLYQTCDDDKDECGCMYAECSETCCAEGQVCAGAPVFAGELLAQGAGDCCTPSGDEVCDNQADEDCDGYTDCADEDCVEDPACSQRCGGRDLCTWTQPSNQEFSGLPLGSPNCCSCNLNYNTFWAVGSESEPSLATVTCTFTGGGYEDYLLYISVDNDVVSCTLNGNTIIEDYVHDNCASQDPRDNSDVPFPVSLLPTGGDNTLVCVVRDRGSMTFFDACVVGSGECATSESVCDNQVDDDCDTLIDCADSDCASDPACCVPNCGDKECGSDGCGGSCGSCGDREICNNDYLCECEYVDCFGTCCAQGEVCNGEVCATTSTTTTTLPEVTHSECVYLVPDSSALVDASILPGPACVEVIGEGVDECEDDSDCVVPVGLMITSPPAGTEYVHVSAPVPVVFTGSVETAYDCCNVTWTFGDGGSYSEVSCNLTNLVAYHTYGGLGTYYINLSTELGSCYPLKVTGAAASVYQGGEVLSDSTDIYIRKQPYRPTTTLPAPTTTLPSPTTTLPSSPTTTLPAPTTTLPSPTTTLPVVTTTLPPTPTTLSPPKEEPPVEEPEVIGYAVAPFDYLAALRSSGLRNLILLLILLAGYATWARDTQLMKRADEAGKGGRLGK